jgi:photosystem II stability/assembly factor-like uncharacterized protein
MVRDRERVARLPHSRCRQDLDSLRGAASQGTKPVFSIAVVDADHLAIVGGDYDHPQMVKPNSAYTDDGGRTWKESSHRPAGYRWCVAIVPDTPGQTAFAVGPTGMDYSIDRGKNWVRTNEVDANTIAFADSHRGWGGGRKGLILKFEGTVPGRTAPSLQK